MTQRLSRRRILLYTVEGFLILLVLCIVARTILNHASNLLELLRKGDVSGIESYLEEKGSEGKWILILLQAIETISVFLPAVPVYLCAGVIYGTGEGILICWVTNLALNLLMFLLARVMKHKISQSGIAIRNKRVEYLTEAATKPERATFLMCLIPVVPNGLIPYISARTKMTAGKFLLAIGLGSLPPIAFFVSGGDLLLDKHFHITVPIALLLLGLAGILWLNRKKIIEDAQPVIRKFLGIEDPDVGIPSRKVTVQER